MADYSDTPAAPFTERADEAIERAKYATFDLTKPEAITALGQVFRLTAKMALLLDEAAPAATSVSGADIQLARNCLSSLRTAGPPAHESASDGYHALLDNIERALAASPASVTSPQNQLAPEVVKLFKAAWDMMVEQQAGPEGWSMAKRWAFEKLAAAMEPFRTEYGDELDLAKVTATTSLGVAETGKAIDWTLIDEGGQPSAGDWLVAVHTDSGDEVHTLEMGIDGDWLHDGEPTYCHGYYFSPYAWAAKPTAPADEAR